MDLLSISIGIGLGLSLLFSELFGIATGGMIVPGYMALHIKRPIEIIMTILAAFVTFFIVRLLSNVMIIYGRRRTVLMVLVGYIMGYVMRLLYRQAIFEFSNIDANLVGYIIPGLIAIWFDRQGIIETITSLIIATVLVRLVLIIFLGNELLQL